MINDINDTPNFVRNCNLQALNIQDGSHLKGNKLICVASDTSHLDDTSLTEWNFCLQLHMYLHLQSFLTHLFHPRQPVDAIHGIYCPALDTRASRSRFDNHHSPLYF
jgi:hypothetical protein